MSKRKRPTTVSPRQQQLQEEQQQRAHIQSTIAAFRDMLAVLQELEDQVEESALDPHEVQHIQDQVKERRAHLRGEYIDFLCSLFGFEKSLVQKATADDVAAVATQST